jgi:hypothetical protein
VYSFSDGNDREMQLLHVPLALSQQLGTSLSIKEEFVDFHHIIIVNFRSASSFA